MARRGEAIKGSTGGAEAGLRDGQPARACDCCLTVRSAPGQPALRVQFWIVLLCTCCRRRYEGERNGRGAGEGQRAVLAGRAIGAIGVRLVAAWQQHGLSAVLRCRHVGARRTLIMASVLVRVNLAGESVSVDNNSQCFNSRFKTLQAACRVLVHSSPITTVITQGCDLARSMRQKRYFIPKPTASGAGVHLTWHNSSRASAARY